MNPNRLQVGIDFSQKLADFCLLFPDGQPLISHQAFANTRMGYQKARQVLVDKAPKVITDVGWQVLYSYFARAGFLNAVCEEAHATDAILVDLETLDKNLSRA